MTEKIELTAAGKVALETELNELVTVRRPAVIERIAQAKGFGDLSENSEYDDAKNDQGFIESRIAEIEYILEHSFVVVVAKGNKKVQIGTCVEFKNLTTGDVKAFDIVASVNANPMNQKMSNESPIGAAFMGHKKGDIVDAKLPNGSIVSFEILSVKASK